ncbi:MAG: DUF2148 domain-containing protein, partial [Candidatus Omnitrophota bacterium]
MARKYEDIKTEVLKDIAELMCVLARTAPKTRGKDNLVIIIPTKAEKKRIITKMRYIAKRDSRPSCERDAKSIKNADQIVVIGTKKETLGLNCGFCGYPACSQLSKTKGVCAYNSMDLGIAIGSAASLAGRAHIDNRLMYSIGKAAIECGVF